MSKHEVKCVNKSQKEKTLGIIQNIGGYNPDGTRWRITKERAIDGIESGKWEFFVRTDGQEVKVVVSTYLNRKILKTEKDGFESNNLINLPECPY